jgi:hypothetical protein
MIIKIDIPSTYEVNSAKPDQYEYDTDLLMPRPNPNFVMTKDKFGNVASRYCDNQWDYAAYNMSSHRIDFNDVHPDYIDDAKWLLFLFDRVIARGRNGNNYSVGSLKAYLHGVIKPLCSYAQSKHMSIFSVLESKVHMTILTQLNIGVTACYLKLLHFSNSLNEIGFEKLGFIVNIDVRTTAKIKAALKKKKENEKQTTIIPPRLYGNFINQAWNAIDEYLKVEKDILGYLDMMATLPPPNAMCGQESESEKHERLKLTNHFLKDNSITNILSRHSIGAKGEPNAVSISSYVRQVRKVCKDLIHIYSGMRDNEANNLPNRCFIKTPHKKRRHARLIGHTFKYTGYKSPGNWVTTSDLEPVIHLLNRQNKIIVKSAKNRHGVDIEGIAKETHVPSLLFLSTTFLNGYSDNTHTENRKIPKSDLRGFKLYDLEQFRITEQDLVFLQRFEPERDWELEGYNLGDLWTFSSHQFRRALAVYSRQSGLVSIGSLQTQLHHLFVETSYYYANNAENCTFDVTDKDHMSKEFTLNSATADFAAFIFDIMFSEEPLYGVQGNVHERTIRQVANKETWVQENRIETERKFSKGLISHSDTPLGSCSSTEPCNEKLTRNLTGCIKCKGASLKLTKIKRTIDIQVTFIETLDPNSVEYRSEKFDLDQLIELRDKVA